MALKQKRTKIFISYSHEDIEWRDRVRKSIHVLKLEGMEVDIWDDRDLLPGTIWKNEIEKVLNETKIAVLLISNSFLSSDFIINDELPPLLKAAANDGAIILPLILSQSRFSENKNIAKFQAVNDPLIEPLEKLDKNSQEKILTKLANTICNFLRTENSAETLSEYRAKNNMQNDSVDFKFVFRKTWDLSFSHIATLLRVSSYNSEAVLQETLEEENDNVKFIEALFVSPKEEKVLMEFLDSDKRGLFIIGKSGMGKSNLLCSGFLKQRRSRNLNIFIDARRLRSTDIKTTLINTVANRINNDWDLKDFDDFLELNETKITFFIDALNEYNNVGGAIGLLEKIYDFIEDANIFKNIKIIASSRNEIWDQFKSKIGTLNSQYFHTQSGDAVILKGFDEGKESEDLYDSYQKYYKLVPESYFSLKSNVKELIKHPVMMRFIAEIYSNRNDDFGDKSIDSKIKKIPNRLDYFSLFHHLTKRKQDDVKRLLADESEREQEKLGADFKECLYRFARILYDKIGNPVTMNKLSEAGNDKSDTIKDNQLEQNEDFKKFYRYINKHDKTTVLSAAIQVGVIDKEYIEDYDAWGEEDPELGYKYFHDQYTQFWLSAVYSKDIIGNIKRVELKTDRKKLVYIISQIEHILEISQNAPVLSGALYHWLYKNVFDENSLPNENFIYLFNQLAEKKSNSIDYFIGAFFHWLIETNIVTAQSLNNIMVQKGDKRLRKCFYEHIPQAWPEISPSTMQVIIAYEEEEEFVERIADIFVNLFTIEQPEEIIKFLDKTLLGYESFKDMALRIPKINRLRRDFLFALIFIGQAILCNYSDSHRLYIIRDFLRDKYSWILNVLTNSKARGINRKIRNAMFKAIETSGIYNWEQAVASQANNRFFFEENLGLNQRDVLRDFYKFCAAFQNDTIELFSLDSDSEYMRLTFKMMKYKNRSLIGYVATLILVYVLRRNMDKLDEIIDEIIKLKSQPAMAYTISVIHMLAKLDPESVNYTMEIVHEKLLPEMIDNLGKGEDKYNISSFFAIGAVNFERHWKKCEAIFSATIEHLTTKRDKKAIDDYGDMMVESVFPPEKMIGINLCAYLLRKKLHENQLWCDFTYKFMAAMMARSPKTLTNLLDEYQVDNTIINEVRLHLTEDIRTFGNKVSYQHAWNNLLVLGCLNNKQISYLLIKYVLTSLVQSSSVEEFMTVAPEIIVELIKIYIMEEITFKNLNVVDSLPNKSEVK